MRKAAKYGEVLAILSVLLGLTAGLQYYFDLEKEGSPSIPPTIIPAQILKAVNLGLNSATASLMWLYTVQEAGSQTDKLAEMIENINNIDPRFSYPYAFGTLVLPDLGFMDKAVEIGELGIKNSDPDWRIPYYLGVIHHIYRQDRPNTLKYFAIASEMPGAPAEIIRVSTTYGASPDLRSQTRQIWSSIYTTSTDELIKERALAYITNLDIFDLLEEAAGIYKKRFGYYPKDPQDLVKAHILKEIPKSPFGLEYIIDPGRGRASLKVE